MVTVDWHIICVAFLFISNCYQFWAAIPSGVVFLFLCFVSLVLFSGVYLFTHFLSLCVTFLCAFQSVLECHLQCQQRFCFTDPGGIVLLLWMLPLCV